MFVDASALTAMLVDEHDASELLARMQAYATRTTSPLAILETVLAVARIIGLEVKVAEAAVEEFVALTNITVTPVPAETRGLAIDAFERFGKGRHPASLNLGIASPTPTPSKRAFPFSTKVATFHKPTSGRRNRR